MAITTLNIVKAALNITDTSKDNRIEALIPIVESEILGWRNKAFDVDELGNIIYPSGSELIAIKLIGLELSSKQGVAAEKLATYAVTYFNEDMRKGILKGIKRYASVV